MADNSILNNSYVVGIGGRNLVLNTFGRVYVKVQDKYYELDFKNSSSGGAGSSEIIIVDTKDAVQALPYPGDHSFILTKDGFIYYTENNNFIPFDINSDGIKLVNPHIIGTITIDSEGKTPFVINSKTLVKNLNAEYLNGYNSDEFALLSENETVTGLWSFINDVFVQNRIYGTEAELDFATGRLVVNELIVKNGSAYTSYFEVDDHNNLYAKDERGIYSENFISCKGLDTTAVGTFGYATEAYVNSEIAKLINGAPETLDTLGELAEAINNNQGGWEALEQSIVRNTEDIKTLQSYFSDGSANKAVSLKNERKIWGHVFNGTQDITGDLTFSLDQILSPSSGNEKYISANCGLVSETFISCKGFDPSAIQMISNLGDLTNVSISSPSDGESLVYDNGYWKNKFVQGGGGINSETDPIFTNSAAAGITLDDIANWNSKTSNQGTITGIIMNGSSLGTSGTINLGTVITSLDGYQKTINANNKLPWTYIEGKPSYTTDEISEGSKNKYFTDAKAIAAMANATIEGNLTVKGKFYDSSDIRLKNIISNTLDDVSLEDILSIPRVRYTWKNKESKQMIGTIAQELIEKFQELLEKDESGLYCVDYDAIGILALEGLAKLYDLVKSLDSKLNTLNNGK